MTALEIINLILSILSLIATIAISFVIYFLEKRNSNIRREQAIKEEARRFIVQNAEERDYLHWCTVASGCFPQNKHTRKIYNEFSLLEKDVQKEVLRQAGFEISLIENDSWIDNKIAMLDEAIKELDIGDSFLYNGAKYFHRLYDYKDANYEVYGSSFWNERYDDVFGFERLFQKTKGKISFTRYLDDYLYCKYEKNEKFSKKFIKPLDYLLAVEEIRTTDEETVCFWISHIIEECLGYALKYLNYVEKDHTQTDAQIKTFEDRYFEVLYDLYYFDKKIAKSRG